MQVTSTLLLRSLLSCSKLLAIALLSALAYSPLLWIVLSVPYQETYRPPVAYVIPYDDSGQSAEFFDPWVGVPMCPFALPPDVNGRVRYFEREC